VDLILDAAGQKGTGKWTVVAALDDGTPLTLIGEAVFARCLSAVKEERAEASQQIKPQVQKFTGDKARFRKDLRAALYAAKIVSYAQGYQLVRAAARTYRWKLNCGGVALVWRGRCIIQSVFLGEIAKAFRRKPDLVNLLLDEFFKKAVSSRQAGWRRVVARAAQLGIPVPCLASGLANFDGYRSARLPAYLLQAQRDYFSAHTYERVDKPRGQVFHTNWTGRGGATTSQAYAVRGAVRRSVSTIAHLTVAVPGPQSVRMDPELRQALDAFEQKLGQRMTEEIQASEGRMREHVTGEIRASAGRMREHIRASGEETRRHTEVLIEGLRADFRIATEAITPLNRRVDALEEREAHTTRRVDLLEGRVSVVESRGKTPGPRRR
jgi:6-phosphogluconate dehydrogenase (decarboxylating)